MCVCAMSQYFFRGEKSSNPIMISEDTQTSCSSQDNVLHKNVPLQIVQYLYLNL